MSTVRKRIMLLEGKKEKSCAINERMQLRDSRNWVFGRCKSGLRCLILKTELKYTLQSDVGIRHRGVLDSEEKSSIHSRRLLSVLQFYIQIVAQEERRGWRRDLGTQQDKLVEFWCGRLVATLILSAGDSLWYKGVLKKLNSASQQVMLRYWTSWPLPDESPPPSFFPPVNTPHFLTIKGVEVNAGQTASFHCTVNGRKRDNFRLWLQVRRRRRKRETAPGSFVNDFALTWTDVIFWSGVSGAPVLPAGIWALQTCVF